MSAFVDKVTLSTPKNNKINLSHTLSTSYDFFQNRVLGCFEMLPSDNFDITLNTYTRCAPMAAPVYGRIENKYMAFFVPNRIIWDNWNKFLTGGATGEEEISVPSVSMYNLTSRLSVLNTQLDDSISFEDGYENLWRSRIHNYCNYLQDLGIPIRNILNSDGSLGTSYSTNDRVSVLPFRAVKCVWFDWLRDQNLISEALRDTYLHTDDSSHFLAGSYIDYVNDDFVPLPCPYEKDFFTTLMTDPQRGSASSVQGDIFVGDTQSAKWKLDSASLSPYSSSSTSGQSTEGLEIGVSSTGSTTQTSPETYRSLSSQFTINMFRLANGLQKWLEKNNIAGSNALQQLLAHWGTAPNPAVFNRSVYIGSHTSDLNVDEITSINGASDGNFGEVNTKLNGGSSANFKYTANEHGYFIIMQVCRPVVGYYQGLDKSLQRFDRFDYFTPELEATGYQPVYSREIFCRTKGTSLTTLDNLNSAIVGYQPRYGEYKFLNNRVTGDLTKTDGVYYHLNRDLSAFNDAYYSAGENMPITSTLFTMVGEDANYPNGGFDRIFKDSNVDFDHFIQVVHFDFKAIRPMQSYAIPTIADIRGDDTSLPYAGVRL